MDRHAVLFTAATGALQSQSPGAANHYLSTPSALANSAQWELYANLKFATSGANCGHLSHERCIGFASG
ncbi:MAG: hypothetical protein IPG74_03505 [Flavobacteriales bacterium]|nr:hypothetical protein [Flavobacteriales bacterium]